MWYEVCDTDSPPLSTAWVWWGILRMTDHEGNRKIYLAWGIQQVLETVDYCPKAVPGDANS